MNKSRLFFELLTALGDTHSEADIAYFVNLLSSAANDNYGRETPRYSPSYHSKAVDTAMRDGGWAVLGMETRIGTLSNDNCPKQTDKEKAESLLGIKI